MKLVLFTKTCGRFGCLNINCLMVIAAVLVLFVAIPGVALYGGYQLGMREVQPQPVELVSRWESDMATQRQAVRDAIERSEANINALAVQLGRMQASVIRLDALGQRLTEIASLEQGEFDFDNPPAVGGPVDSAELQSMSVTDFIDELGQLSLQLDDREHQLEVLESMLMNRTLQTESRPAGQPVKSGWLSSKFGKRTDPFSGKQEYHKGVDFAGKSGSEVVAVAAGVVTLSEGKTGYGKLVEVNHGNGYVTRYGHNKEVLVEVGDKVEKGQALALMGSTGRSTGPHVHFEVIRNGKVVNPSKYISAAR